jgi:cobalt-zinc-cadmium efflux system protein
MTSESHRSEQKNLGIAILATTLIMGVEIAGGLLYHSLALLSDAWHMFTDVLSMLLCFLAGMMALKPPTADKTFGYHRVEVLSALANGVTLVVVALYIFYEAFLRILSPHVVEVSGMLIVALIGLIANIVSMTYLSKSIFNINIKSAFLHVVGDTLSSVGVVLAAIIMFFTGWYIIDPIVSIIVGVAIIYGTLRMLREVIHILMEGTPSKIKVAEVIKTLKAVPSVVDVHDAHIWSITSYVHYLSAHVVVDGDGYSESGRVLNELKEKIRERHGINHTTIQLETAGYEEVGEVHSNSYPS